MLLPIMKAKKSVRLVTVILGPAVPKASATISTVVLRRVTFAPDGDIDVVVVGTLSIACIKIKASSTPIPNNRNGSKFISFEKNNPT